jgi:hypothetical protein
MSTRNVGKLLPYYTESHSKRQRSSYYVSATKPSRLMLQRETVVVYCESHMEHINTLCGQKTQSVPHGKRYFSATKFNRLLLFRETIAVYCETHTEPQIHSVGRRQSSLKSKQVEHIFTAML